MPDYPSLCQVNTRVWLTARSRQLGRPATLDDVADRELDEWAALGFDWIWLLSVWQTGPAGRAVSRSRADWRRGFEESLGDLREEDIGGSGFAIRSYRVADSLGGEETLARLRERLTRRGLKLMLDFVPNHVALDHPWVEEHPDFFIEATAEQYSREPHNYIRLSTSRGQRILAHGRDPYFPGWPDSLQLNHAHRALQEALMKELETITQKADGVRCDMAMLLLPEVFERTWGVRPAPFWAEAIERARRRSATFRLLAEVYWDLEWVLQQLGFDYTYDKRLYDRLRAGETNGIRGHLRAGLDFQDRLARFLENHDEPRAAAVFSRARHEAAAVVSYFIPGMRFFQQGQLEGQRVHVSPHLIRAPTEETDESLRTFYRRLLETLKEPVFRGGNWRLLQTLPAGAENATHESLLAFGWDSQETRRLVCVNYAGQASQCFVPLPWEMAGREWLLRDRMGEAEYARDGAELARRGLYLDMAAWGHHVLELLEL